MLTSMTGFGRFAEVVGGIEITAELKSVNHRFLECSVRTPRNYGFLDDKIKSAVSSKVRRGKVEVYITIHATAETGTKIEINREVLSSYVAALRSVADEYGLVDDLSLGSVSRFSDIFTAGKETPDEDGVAVAVIEVLSKALDGFVAMKKTEGQKLSEDLKKRLDVIDGIVGQIELRAPETLKNYRDKLTAKLLEVLENTTFDEHRMLTEAAIFAERIATHEETVRLRSHITEGKSLLARDEAVGKKFDFLLQEMVREVNTIGSKAQDIEISKLVIETKSELEKIREQIQNIE